MYAPIHGKILALEGLRPHPLAKKLVGDGFAVLPFQGKVVAPFEGKIEAILANNHTIVLTEKNGLKVLIHIGVNTKQAPMEYFTLQRNVGDTVFPGEELVHFDLVKLKENGYDSRTMVIFPEVFMEQQLSIYARNEVRELEFLGEIFEGVTE